MSNSGVGLWPTEVARLYGISADMDAAGECVGIIALGGGYDPNDIAKASQGMGRAASPAITAVSVTSSNNPGADNVADKEIALDVQILAGIVPSARIVVYFADTSEAGLAAAFRKALSDTVNQPHVLSISWGIAEASISNGGFHTIQGILAGAGAAKVSVVAAAGDALATANIFDGGAHVLYPASSDFVIGCGGTQVVLAADGATVAEETVWGDGVTGTGGGISERVPVPGYQQNTTLPTEFLTGLTGRGVPDVAAAAAQNPGYRIVLAGSETVASGTSAATPLWAALIAMANAKRGRPLGGSILSFLYQNHSLCRGIVSGTNRFQGIGYDAAGPGWNACTGWGVPNGVDTVNALAAVP